jgi:hypothetical protein
MGLAEDLKALQELREKGELTEAAYKSARDATMHKHGVAPSGSFQMGRLTGKFLLVPVVLLLLIAGLYFATKPRPPKIPQMYSTPDVPYVRPQPQPHSIPITNGALTVAAGNLSWYTFVVPPNASAVQVQGHFTATGGMGNDIIAYVTDDDGLVNLRNGHQARVYYNSQKVTQSEISAVLPNAPVTYYLVFDNRFSLITPKAVAVNATLSYIQ